MTRTITLSPLVAGALLVAAVLLAGLGGYLIGDGSRDGQQVQSLAEAIALANEGELPTGSTSDGRPSATSSATTVTSNGVATQIVVRAVVTDKRIESGHNVIVLSTRAGDRTMRADQIAEVAGFADIAGGASAIPVGASVLLFQSTFGPDAPEATDYRIAVLPPGFEG